MEDEKIISLYWDRDERAITESAFKYGRYCHSIASNILKSESDAEECVNDTWLRAWNAMPPHRPSVLSVFLGKITRNLSIDRYKSLHRQKRGGGQIDLVLDEISEIVSGRDNPEEMAMREELQADINRFLSSLPKEKKYMFILRYWYADSIADIAGQVGMSENNVTVSLSRIRGKLRKYLADRGYAI
ncbi:MAG: sigma-70 family RNA polymerase sigma factor [Lachnospiraceae bacterium]|nr:sigma-70 family RNA polymerase sigma factor [Lachnospiraceae bacterium]